MGDRPPYGLSRFAKRSLSLWIVSASVFATAQTTDEDLGRQWARCAEEARLAEEFLAKSPGQKRTLRETSSILGAYAAAALGEKRAEDERIRIHDDFVFSSLRQTSDLLKDKFSRWSVTASVNAKACAASFGDHRQRFQARVQTLLRASSRRKDAKDIQ
ncbi:hypothetical protein [Denitromonas ohlonensis]|uniref:DUF1311 domain-containing protein n=2 Tax=Denitromonas TaxID=139331 RepID=A0A557RBX9_9RHOO|nr:hypothetical protein [Denitromonas ohlonensis]TVO62671.1 hypothetical protein FHP90_16765 [Denitromonas ohlonensis]TVO78875.1 hypothetical protein FHP89_04245 [Denitromonas ohlonensis]TVT49309.1 MAG: hypothetical protein FHP94_06885 [Denitromonas halophila]TVT74514.1 MAG: hypothetical protein FHP93_03775 [Denitromonas halophila]